MDTWSKRTQSKPIQTHFEPDANPKQTQSNQIALAEEGFEGAVVGFSCAEEGNFGEFYDSADVVEAWQAGLSDAAISLLAFNIEGGK